MKARNFLFIDSYYEQQSAYSKKTSNLLIKNFMTLWFEAGLKRIHFEKFGTFYPNVPKQNNGDDCGIFLIKYI